MNQEEQSAFDELKRQLADTEARRQYGSDIINDMTLEASDLEKTINELREALANKLTPEQRKVVHSAEQLIDHIHQYALHYKTMSINGYDVYRLSEALKVLIPLACTHAIRHVHTNVCMSCGAA